MSLVLILLPWPLISQSNYGIITIKNLIDITFDEITKISTMSSNSSTMSSGTINMDSFYGQYHGHAANHLIQLIRFFRQRDKKPLIFLAGDSSLDNKYWLPSNQVEPATNGYENILSPPSMKPDIAYQVNRQLRKHRMNYIAVNCAIEESTIKCRDESLKDQDRVILNNITNEDILIVSVGGNDIALSPTISTIWNMVILNYLNSTETIQNRPDSAWGMSYFVNMFKDKLRSYVLKLIGTKRPKKILVCAIYFPDSHMTGGWADRTLGFLGYNSNPDKLQEVIRQIFTNAISQIKIDGSEVIPVPMYEAMDGSDSNDYVQRVEPSIQGGNKLAKLFVSKIQ